MSGARVERHVTRRIEPVIRSRMLDEPVVALQGPRAVGKTTLLRAVGQASNGTVLDLDDPATRAAVEADPVTFVSGPGPVFIDEYQHVPMILDAIKAELNRDGSPGRFVISGSTRHDALPRAAQALTGRLHLMDILPLAQGEIDGTPDGLVARLFAAPASTVDARPSTTTREQYIARVTDGGFPPALRRASPGARSRWFDDYLALCLERDVAELARIQQKAALPKLLARLAGQTAQMLNIASAGEAAGLKTRTAENYTKLLEALFLVQRLPAWGTTLRARAVAMPKLHVIDAGLAAHLLRLTPEKLARRDATAMQEFGHLLETFVTAEVMKQLSWMDDITGLGHWRTHDGAEVDLIIERRDGTVVAIEVKAGTRITTKDLTGLRAIRDALGDSFAAGVVLSTGPQAYRADDRIQVLPIDRLWSTP
ncbi:MAG: ATP-binding protein [Actinomycetota bacterium]